MSAQTRNRAPRRIESMLIRTLALLLVGAFTASGIAVAADSEVDKFWEAFTGGKPTLDMRLRIEIAELDGLDQSEAYTLRTRLGYGTAAYHGASLYADFENTTAVATSQYWDTVERATGQTPIADPTNTEVNQAFLKYARKEFGNLLLIGGRQRITLDDVRFIGNVVWRQNEQTYDAAYGSSSLGVDDMEMTYGYLGYIRRIWGNQDKKAPGDPGYGSTLDWQSNSHIIHGSYAGVKFVEPTVFVYLLDLSNDSNTASDALANGFSSASYGLRLTGAPEIVDKLKLAYAVSYAYQTDYADNPVDYGAHYVLVDAKLQQDDLGSVGIGWEMLGSDAGKARFVTPLATLHKHNGWADRFLGNGGVRGLRDLYVNVSPKLPWGLTTSLIYHYFRSDDDSEALGDEFDAILKRSFGKYFYLLFKSAYYHSRDDTLTLGTGLNRTVWRVVMDAGIKF